MIERQYLWASILALGLAASVAGAGVFAQFSDTETSATNTIQAGTLDLKPEEVSGFSLEAYALAPGETVGPENVSLYNDGTIDGDHIELTTSYAENDGAASTDNTTNVTAEAFAKALEIETLYIGPKEAFNDRPNVFSALQQVPGAFVYDFDESGTEDTDVRSSTDPNASRDGVIRITTGGDDGVDYGASNVDLRGQGLTIADFESTPASLTYDYREGADNTNAAPDEVYLVVEDDQGKHLVFRNFDDDAADRPATAWHTRNVGQEIAGQESYAGTNDWIELDLDTGDTTSLGDAITDDFASDAAITQLGVGLGNAGTSSSAATVQDVRYADVDAAGTTLEFRADTMNLDDLSSVTLDNQQNLPANHASEEPFEAAFSLDAGVGNAFQNDGVDVDFTFRLNQAQDQ